MRIAALLRLPREQRRLRGQFFTPAPVAQLLASMLVCNTPNVSLLDAGAGVGSLFAAVVTLLCRREKLPKSIHIVAYETEPLLADYAENTLQFCRRYCQESGVELSGQIKRIDFLQEAVSLLETDLMQTSPCIVSNQNRFTCVIQNPPYHKITSNSEARSLLRRLGLETTNLYAGFLFAAMCLMAENGELVAITPRSFCNGLYFRPFRERFLRELAIQRLHLFDTRREAFKDDSVLQETLIISAVKQMTTPEYVTVSSGLTADEDFLWRKSLYSEVVHPDDPEQFIRIIPDEAASKISRNMAHFNTPLADLGLNVSTGRVVDFRATLFLKWEYGKETAPLIWPFNLNSASNSTQKGYVHWPVLNDTKPCALAVCSETEALLIPNGNYVLVKRFSVKEEFKRITAAIYEGERINEASQHGVGIENHLNYFHANGEGLELTLARGLAVFLNATMTDEYFRIYSGHTQVNATDLRNLRYPTRDQLLMLGNAVNDNFPNQDQIDDLLEKVSFFMEEASNAVLAKKQIDKAMTLLAQIGLPAAQQNERAALTLLALLKLTPGQTWAEAENPMMGITPIMEFASKHYGKTYAPNTRETIRRFTVHQFLEAGLLVANPDKIDRPVNSPHTVYQVETSALELIRTFEAPDWEQSAATYLDTVQTLKERYAQERAMTRIPIQIMPGHTITLSPGGQNVLVEKIIKDFCPFYVPGGTLLYVGDTDNKFAYHNQQEFAALGIKVDAHGKMPDVIVHYVAKNWLILIEAVTSHGPVNAKRHAELTQLFQASSAGLVFVTAFLTRKAFSSYSADISWQTEVWLADAPTHLIHFNGERFLGPYT